MFDIGWQELFIVAAIAIIVVGPRDLPKALKSITGYIGKARSMVRELQSGIDEVAREVDIDNIRKEAQSAAFIDFEDDIETAMKPIKDIGQELESSEQTKNFDKASSDTLTAKADKISSDQKTEPKESKKNARLRSNK